MTPSLKAEWKNPGFEADQLGLTPVHLHAFRNRLLLVCPGDQVHTRPQTRVPGTGLPKVRVLSLDPQVL